MFSQSRKLLTPRHPTTQPNTTPPHHRTTQPRNTQPNTRPNTQHPNTRPITHPKAGQGDRWRGRGTNFHRRGERGLTPNPEGRKWRTPCRRGGRGERPTGARANHHRGGGRRRTTTEGGGGGGGQPPPNGEEGGMESDPNTQPDHRTQHPTTQHPTQPPNPTPAPKPPFFQVKRSPTQRMGRRCEPVYCALALF